MPIKNREPYLRLVDTFVINEKDYDYDFVEDCKGFKLSQYFDQSLFSANRPVSCAEIFKFVIVRSIGHPWLWIDLIDRVGKNHSLYNFLSLGDSQIVGRKNVLDCDAINIFCMQDDFNQRRIVTCLKIGKEYLLDSPRPDPFWSWDVGTYIFADSMPRRSSLLD